jgi:hypothetical protein
MKYVVRLGLIERCYVERDYIIDADSPQQAEEFALHGENVVDAGPDRCCMPESIEDAKIVTGAQPAE